MYSDKLAVKRMLQAYCLLLLVMRIRRQLLMTLMLMVTLTLTVVMKSATADDDRLEQNSPSVKEQMPSQNTAKELKNFAPFLILTTE